MRRHRVAAHEDVQFHRLNDRVTVALAPVVVGYLPPLPATMGGVAGWVIREVATGLMIGALLRMMLSALATAGEIVSLQTTLAFAQTANPFQAQPGSTLAAFLTLLGVTLIFATDTHHLFIAGLAGVLMAESTTTLSPASFMVVGALVALALTYLGGIASISGALVAGLLAQAGLLTTLSSALSDGDVGRYVFATSGIALILTAILAPDGVTGLVRRGLSRRRPIPQDRDQDLPQPERTDQVVSA